MTWLKVAAAALGVFIAFAIVSTVAHYLIWAAFAALFVAVVVVAVKAASRGKSVAGKKADPEVSEPREVMPAPRPQAANVDDELARLKREMGR
jgi:hypothetical protein